MRAAQYLRVSSPKQSAAIGLQRQDIANYAATNGFDIVRTYEDVGKSGLRLEGRDGLRELLGDVVSKRADYEAILVQDVSRWGRFQDPDESAHYEYICRAAGIAVRYCQEAFDNRPSPTSGILKAVKRLMAAEFSRELSEKTKRAQLKWVKLGFKMGGVPGYGLRRQHLSGDGSKRGILKSGEMKLLQSDRVILVWGPPNEVATVRRIYRLYLEEGLPMREIAHLLNAEGTLGEDGRFWGDWSIAEVLGNTKYAGEYSYGRRRRDLNGNRTPEPGDTWVRIKDKLDPIVSRVVFDAVRRKRQKRMLFLSPDEMFQRAKDLLALKGHIDRKLITAAEGLPSPRTYYLHFGPINRLYAKLHYYPLDLSRYGNPTHGILPGYIDGMASMPPKDGTTELFPMSSTTFLHFTAFAGDRLIAAGALEQVALATKKAHDQGDARLLVFSDATGEVVELDLRGTPQDVISRLPTPESDADESLPIQVQGRGRPKLGVTAREVTLLPRHWQWLGDQPGGASAAIRKLVEQAARDNIEIDTARRKRDAAYKVMYALAGHLPGFEDGLRAFFAGDHVRFEEIARTWPEEIASYAIRMASAS